MTHVSINSLSKRYAGNTEFALSPMSLSIESGSLTALLGPSGCGKTTVMKLVAGLLSPTAGDIALDGRSITNLPPERRGVVMLFQHHLLFPHMSVIDNVAFGLAVRGENKEQRYQRARDMLERVQLTGMEARKPDALSGGQQQRVALARALVLQPRVLLLDEPLSNLDAGLRDDMRSLIRELHAALGLTTIMVTHDQEEAVIMADAIAVMHAGQLLQHGAPETLYQRPESERVARFLGGRNFIRGQAESGQFLSDLGPLKLPADTYQGPGVLTIRPEQISLGLRQDAANSFVGLVEQVRFLGSQYEITVRIGDQILVVLAPPQAVAEVTAGSDVTLTLPADQLWVLPSEGSG